MAPAKIEMYWTLEGGNFVVNWRLKGGNGEVMCQSTQGYRDKTDCMRAIQAVSAAFAIYLDAEDIRVWVTPASIPKLVGPGRKPKIK